MKYLLIITLGLFSLSLKSQDTLLLLNGRQYSGVVKDTSGVTIDFNIIKSANKFKEKTFFRDQVFSITSEDGEERVYYFPEIFFEEEYSVDIMRIEISGRIDAKKGYKTNWVYPTGIVTGFLAGYFSKGSALSVIVPVAYVGIVQIPIVKVQHKTISNPDFIGNDYYLSGYNQSARMKRTKHALISGFIGLAAGILLYEATN